MRSTIKLAALAGLAVLVGGVAICGCSGDSGSAATQKYTKTAADGKLPPMLGGLHGGPSRTGGPKMFNGGKTPAGGQ